MAPHAITLSRKADGGRGLYLVPCGAAATDGRCACRVGPGSTVFAVAPKRFVVRPSISGKAKAPTHATKAPAISSGISTRLAELEKSAQTRRLTPTGGRPELSPKDEWCSAQPSSGSPRPGRPRVSRGQAAAATHASCCRARHPVGPAKAGNCGNDVEFSSSVEPGHPMPKSPPAKAASD